MRDALASWGLVHLDEAATLLVSELAGKWGVRETATGKAVWIELTTEQGAGWW